MPEKDSGEVKAPADLTPEGHQEDPPSEYDELTLEETVEEIPVPKMRYKKPGTIGSPYRGGPYSGLVEVDGKYTHNAKAMERDDPTPKEPVSQRFGDIKVGNRREDKNAEMSEEDRSRHMKRQAERKEERERPQATARENAAKGGATQEQRQRS